jgi:hypothetical protein
MNDIETWRANRVTNRLKAKSVTPKPRRQKADPVLPSYASHPDPVIDTIRRVDAAAELIAPVLTDGVLLSVIKRVLAAGRLEVCGCLDAIAADTEFNSYAERHFAAALRSYITVRVHADQAVACIDCHRERCPNVKGGAA